MTFYMNIGDSVTNDEAFDTQMRDDHELTIFRSKEDSDGYSHVILMTIWTKGTVVGHNFAHCLDSEDGLETQESTDDPRTLIDELPEAFQDRAKMCVDRWCAIFLTAEEKMGS